MRNTPVRGRTYDAVLTLAPGAATEAGTGGVSFSGATGPENNFLIDGVNTTDPAFGLAGTQLTLEFVGETEIITGGYNAEYGRATGGVVNVITKSGSNNFHGDVWFYATPFQLDPHLVGRSGEAIATRTKTKYGFDFGFDLGGPIVKDKIWFYVGFQPTFTTTQSDRYIRERSGTNLPSTMMSGAYQGDLDPNVACPKGLDKAFCNTPGLLAPGYVTQRRSALTRHYQTDTRLYNWIAKLNFQLNQNNSLVLQYIGSPQTNSRSRSSAASTAPHDAYIGSSFENTHDASLHFVSKLADRRLQIDVVAGYHYDDITNTPGAGGDCGRARSTSPSSRSRSSSPNVTPCAMQMTHGGAVGFNPCPVQNYRVGGFGFLDHIDGAAYLGRGFGDLLRAPRRYARPQARVRLRRQHLLAQAQLHGRRATTASTPTARSRSTASTRRSRPTPTPTRTAPAFRCRTPASTRRRRRSTTAPTSATRTTSASSPA